MKEEFLHYLWRYRLYISSGLATTDGQPIDILDPGFPHQDGGADFREAKIRIGAICWAGHVEIHFRSSQWYEHGHHRDPAYNNVILHVVLEADTGTKDLQGRYLYTLELKHYIPQGLARSYERFVNDRKKRVPCGDLIGGVSPLIIDDWLDRLAIERLERKAARIQSSWEMTGYDPRETFYRCLGRYFGGKVNGFPFEQLTARLPLRILLRERGSLLRTEALLFGRSGLLKGVPEKGYPGKLLREFRHQQQKYGLKAMDPSAWRFLRLRPPEFPTVRIAQFAALLEQHGDPWNALSKADDIAQVEGIFRVSASEYWKDHYKFERERKRRASARIGKGMVRRLMINAFAPFLFFYGERKGEAEWKARAIGILEGMEAEEDRIQRSWRALGVLPDNAARSQGAIELMEVYCDARKCLKCAIGHRILKERAT